MPLMIVRTTVSVPEGKKEELLKAITKVLVGTGGEESHVMVVLEKIDAARGGKMESIACVDFRSMALSHTRNHEISEGICSLLEKMLGIRGENIYLNFIPIAEGAWGCNHGIYVLRYPEKKWVVE